MKKAKSKKEKEKEEKVNSILLAGDASKKNLNSIELASKLKYMYGPQDILAKPSVSVKQPSKHGNSLAKGAGMGKLLCDCWATSPQVWTWTTGTRWTALQAVLRPNQNDYQHASQAGIYLKRKGARYAIPAGYQIRWRDSKNR